MPLHHNVSIRIPREGLIALLASADAITIAPTAEPVTQHTGLVVAADRYEKQDERGNVLAADSRDHAILIDRQAGFAIDVRALHYGDWASCERYAEGSALASRKWQQPSIEFLFLNVVDRKFYGPAINPDLYPKIRSDRRIWSGTPFGGEDDPARPVFAWYVSGSDGNAHYGSRSCDGLALPVSPLASSPGQ